MTGGIIITHGPVATALIHAAEGIVGSVTHIVGLSTSNFSRETILDKIDETLALNDWPESTIIMVSLKGGSCWNAGIATLKRHPNIAVISGVNLAMLLSFLTKRNDRQLDGLSMIVKEDGIRGIDMFEGT